MVQVERAGVAEGEVIVEIGPGDGDALRATVARNPQKVYGVEISESFRKRLTKDPQLSGVELSGEDCIGLSRLVGEAQVDRVIEMNVVYFLNPCESYLAELYKCLKPGGMLFWDCKWAAVTKKGLEKSCLSTSTRAS